MVAGRARGRPTPDDVQHPLARADWDADAVHDNLFGYVREHLGHPGGMLVDCALYLPKEWAAAGGCAGYRRHR